MTTTTLPTTTTAIGKPKDNVLVLNSKKTLNPPVMTDLNGRQHTNFWFKLEDNTHAQGSCALLFDGQFYAFGSQEGDQQQISLVTQCALKRLGTLPFKFNHGACTSAQQKIHVCFELLSDFQTCRIADNPLGPFKEIHRSIFTHDKIQIASNEG